MPLLVAALTTAAVGVLLVVAVAGDKRVQLKDAKKVPQTSQEQHRTLKLHGTPVVVFKPFMTVVVATLTVVVVVVVAGLSSDEESGKRACIRVAAKCSALTSCSHIGVVVEHWKWHEKRWGCGIVQHARIL